MCWAKWIYWYQFQIHWACCKRGRFSYFHQHHDKKLLDSFVVYDAENESWFHCNPNNLWKESNKPIILKGILSTIVNDIFKLYACLLTKKVIKTNDEKDIQIESSKKINGCFSYLFAFSEKVFDWNTLEVTIIEPEDYIMTNTGD